MAAEAGERSQLKLHGFWSSPYVYRVIWALKLKGIEYEYIEEDLSCKSQALLDYNPVHKKVPVLVHAGRAVAESAVILYYIEETWPDPGYPLLPQDPYDRALARFWIDYGKHVGLTLFVFFLSSDEDKEKTTNEALETLRIIQDQGLGDKKFFNGDRIGLVDLSFGWLAGPWLESSQEIAGVQLLNPDSLPKLHRWAVDFRQEPVIKENQVDREAMLAHSKRMKEKLGSMKLELFQ